MNSATREWPFRLFKVTAVGAIREAIYDFLLVFRHGLYNSTSCCISQWPSQWEWANIYPISWKPLDRFRWNLKYITIAGRTPTKRNGVLIGGRGLGEHPVYHCRVSLSFFFGFLVTCIGRTGGPILTICVSYEVILGKDVPFMGSVDMVRHFGGQIHQKPQFWGRE